LLYDFKVHFLAIELIFIINFSPKTAMTIMNNMSAMMIGFIIYSYITFELCGAASCVRTSEWFGQFGIGMLAVYVRFSG